MNADDKKLWELYKKTDRRELLEKIVEKYLNIVHYLAHKLVVYTSNSLTRDDLYSAGIIGLLEAIKRFDIEKGLEFQTYATIRIRGAIIDEIRRIDWVPRSVRQKSKKIDAAIHALFNKTGRMPSDYEIAEELEISIEEYYKITDNLGPLFLSSLDASIASGGDSEILKIRDIVQDESEESFGSLMMHKKLRKQIIKAIGQLPDKEKLVISLYYYEELNLKEIGMVLGVSESRVSQIHSSAILKLRHSLQNFDYSADEITLS